MLPPRYSSCILLPAMVALSSAEICAQNYPAKPIRIITSGAGGGNDFVSRIIAQGISEPLGQSVIVENRATGFIPGELVAKAPPDGYTLLVYGGTFWIAPLMQTAPYDVVRDFLPITLTDRAPSILVVHPSVPARSVKDLIALARSRPGDLNYASAAAGSGTHLATELFKSMARVNIVRISYKGVGAAISDLIGGQVHMMLSTLAAVAPSVKTGRLKALAVATPQPFSLTPDLPTVSASGLQGYESVTITGVFAPAKTPPAIINRLNQEMLRVLAKSDVKEKFINTGSEVVGSTPEELLSAVKSEISRMGKVIKEAGIRND